MAAKVAMLLLAQYIYNKIREKQIMKNLLRIIIITIITSIFLNACVGQGNSTVINIDSANKSQFITEYGESEAVDDYTKPKVALQYSYIENLMEKNQTVITDHVDNTDFSILNWPSVIHMSFVPSTSGANAWYIQHVFQVLQIKEFHTICSLKIINKVTDNYNVIFQENGSCNGRSESCQLGFYISMKSEPKEYNESIPILVSYQTAKDGLNCTTGLSPVNTFVTNLKVTASSDVIPHPVFQLSHASLLLISPSNDSDLGIRLSGDNTIGLVGIASDVKPSQDFNYLNDSSICSDGSKKINFWLYNSNKNYFMKYDFTDWVNGFTANSFPNGYKVTSRKQVGLLSLADKNTPLSGVILPGKGSSIAFCLRLTIANLSMPPIAGQSKEYSNEVAGVSFAKPIMVSYFLNGTTYNKFNLLTKFSFSGRNVLIEQNQNEADFNYILDQAQLNISIDQDSLVGNKFMYSSAASMLHPVTLSNVGVDKVLDKHLFATNVSWYLLGTDRKILPLESIGLYEYLDLQRSTIESPVYSKFENCENNVVFNSGSSCKLTFYTSINSKQVSNQRTYGQFLVLTYLDQDNTSRWQMFPIVFKYGNFYVADHDYNIFDGMPIVDDAESTINIKANDNPSSSGINYYNEHFMGTSRDSGINNDILPSDLCINYNDCDFYLFQPVYYNSESVQQITLSKLNTLKWRNLTQYISYLDPVLNTEVKDTLYKTSSPYNINISATAEEITPDLSVTLSFDYNGKTIVHNLGTLFAQSTAPALNNFSLPQIVNNAYLDKYQIDYYYKNQLVDTVSFNCLYGKCGTNSDLALIDKYTVTTNTTSNGSIGINLAKQTQDYTNRFLFYSVTPAVIDPDPASPATLFYSFGPHHLYPGTLKMSSGNVIPGSDFVVADLSSFIAQSINVNSCDYTSSSLYTICGLNLSLDGTISNVDNKNMTVNFIYPNNWRGPFDTQHLLEIKIADETKDGQSISNRYDVTTHHGAMFGIYK